MKYIFYIFSLVSNDLPNWNKLIVILRDSPRKPFMEKFLNQNSQFETKSFTELVIEHLMKFEWEIDKYFSSLGKDEFAFTV